MIVIISCGGKKVEQETPELVSAKSLYIGGYHIACQSYARTLVESSSIFILSAKYGLLPLEKKILPYELRLGNIGSIHFKELQKQAKELKILDEEVTVLGGKDYVNLCKAVWSSCFTPLQGVGGIGKQLAWLKKNIEKNRNKTK